MTKTAARQKPDKSNVSPQKAKPLLPVTIEPKVERSPDHPHHNLDRGARAAMARLSGGVSTHAMIQAWTDWAQHLVQSPGRQLELAELAHANALKLMSYAADTAGHVSPPFAPRKHDHRFNDPNWQKPPYDFWKQEFLALQDFWESATDQTRGLRPEAAERTRFLARQTLDLVSPSNFPWLNPEIINETVRTGGANLVTGAAHFMHDYLQTLSQTPDMPPEGYRVGEDLACTPGQVVFRNDLFELIQYTPQTDSVQAEPILIVPAWIMKYYVLDLAPHNSMVNYLVGQGFTVFMISWCNPTADQADLSLEDYRRRGVMEAIDTVCDILPNQKVHTVGYCLGGTILAIAAATMARDKDERLASITLIAAQVDFADAGELLLFLDEAQVALLEDMMWDQGYLDRPQMARAFSIIRAEDLIYSRSVNRYFLGKEDLPTDLGVWVADTTRMPAQMHSEYLRSLFLENRLTAGRYAVEGQVIALKDISAPMFVVATESDHIAPWKSVYKTRLFTDCDLTFALTSGGHNTGIVNEPGNKRRRYRISHRPAGALYVGPDHWLEQQTAKSGSWWIDWKGWLENKSSGLVSAPAIGTTSGKQMKGVPAPGTYVFQT
ncbi:MAG: alpha/beta fold hydrolase [Roseibium sp.]